MSTRVISDRELLHNLRFEVEELREHLAALGVKVERLGVIAGAAEPVASRRAQVAPGDWFYPTFCRVCGHSWEAPTDHSACPECDAADYCDVIAGPLTGRVAS